MTNKVISVHADGHDDHHDRLCMSRRQFLLAGGAMVTLAAIGLPGTAEAAPIHALKASFPKQKIGSLAALKKGIPLDFAYPYPDVQNILVKLGTVAGGGVGPDKDIVAFNQQCTHMGGPLQGTYKDKYQALGPCPLHLTTFDLTKHGMVISGHGTESLPQIVLEVQGDDIYAVGVMGLVYGYNAMTARA
jgi:arsenite oxidase small subunit